MGLRTTTASANSLSYAPLLTPQPGDVEAILKLQPGAPTAYIGPTSGVDEYSGWWLTDGEVLRFDVRVDDELWLLGSDPIDSSIVQILIRSIGNPA